MHQYAVPRGGVFVGHSVLQRVLKNLEEPKQSDAGKDTLERMTLENAG